MCPVTGRPWYLLRMNARSVVGTKIWSIMLLSHVLRYKIPFVPVYNPPGAASAVLAPALAALL